MRIERNAQNQKTSVLIALILLVALIVILVITLSKNKEVKYTTTKCTNETSDVSELTSNITIKSQDNKLTYLSFEDLYVYEDDILLGEKYNTEVTNRDTLNAIEGVSISLTYDPNALLLEVKGTIDYSKLKYKKTNIDPYSNFIKEKNTKDSLLDYLKKKGYTCE